MGTNATREPDARDRSHRGRLDALSRAARTGIAQAGAKTNQIPRGFVRMLGPAVNLRTNNHFLNGASAAPIAAAGRVSPTSPQSLIEGKRPAQADRRQAHFEPLLRGFFAVRSPAGRVISDSGKRGSGAQCPLAGSLARGSFARR